MVFGDFANKKGIYRTILPTVCGDGRYKWDRSDFKTADIFNVSIISDLIEQKLPDKKCTARVHHCPLHVEKVARMPARRECE
jgi:hypothetical protein